MKWEQKKRYWGGSGNRERGIGEEGEIKKDVNVMKRGGKIQWENEEVWMKTRKRGGSRGEDT